MKINPKDHLIKVKKLFSNLNVHKKVPNKTVDALKNETIAKSIPANKVKKPIKITGYTLICFIIFLNILWFAFFIVSVQNTPAIGIGSTSNLDNLSSRIFYIFIASFWKDFVLNGSYTIYSFFNNFLANVHNASTPSAYLFAIAFYISSIAGLVQVILVIALVAISSYQKNIRNVTIGLMSLIPIIGPCVCLYYLGVIHYEIYHKYLAKYNKNVQIQEKDPDLQEQLINLNQELNFKTNQKINLSDKLTSSDEAYSIHNPIGTPSLKK